MEELSVRKVKRGFVSDECVQVMEPYVGSYISIIGNQLMFYKADDFTELNRYLEDGRRFSFPYSSIPEHVEKNFLGKINYVNQLYDFGKKYIVVKDGTIFKNSVFKQEDSDEAILLSQKLHPIFSHNDSFNISYPNLTNYVDKNISDDFLIFLNSGKCVDRKDVCSYIDSFDESSLLCINPIINNPDVFGMKIYRNKKSLDVIVFDFKCSDYSLEDAVELSIDAPHIHEPKIKRRLNPSVDRETILRAKAMSNILNN